MSGKKTSKAKLISKGSSKKVGKAKKLSAPAKKLLIPKKSITISKSAKIKAVSAPAAKSKKLKIEDKYLNIFLTQIGGERAIQIVQEFAAPASDEDIAKRCKLKVSEVRAVLNKLHNYGIAVYERSRDESSGWYSYVWKMDMAHASKIAEARVKEDFSVESTQSSIEQGCQFYHCKDCGNASPKIPFETAMDYSFKCPQCGNGLAFYEKKE
ncbi:Transcription factor E [Candidatus Gugararchaeum adminiculabundum]|nr:Transcription factor E [Candidatus Gugararchaeum adminiculabundum]